MRYLERGFFFLLLLVIMPALAVSNTWTPTGAMSATRSSPTATLLSSGKVLVAGGSPNVGFSTGLASAELYDPATSHWSATGTMNAARVAHTATLLPSGKVLVAGGEINNLAELYDPATGQWTLTGSPNSLRGGFHTATLLASGKVLVTGGITVVSMSLGVLATAELYDPATAQWTPTGTMNSPRIQHAATLLPSGKVLVSGGSSTFGGSAIASAELYDPATGNWSATASMNIARQIPTATLLATGKVLVASSATDSSGTAEVYDPATGQWANTAPMVAPHNGGAAALLPSGQVLVAGGITTSSCELFDATGHWTATGAMSTHRGFAASALLPFGELLITGGGAESTPLASAELYGDRIFTNGFEFQ